MKRTRRGTVDDKTALVILPFFGSLLGNFWRNLRNLYGQTDPESAIDQHWAYFAIVCVWAWFGLNLGTMDQDCFELLGYFVGRFCGPLC